jgi:hypothetical protein
MSENSYLVALNALAPVLPAKLFDQAAHVLLQALLPLPAAAPELAKRATSPAPSRPRARKRAAAARRRRARSNGKAANGRSSVPPVEAAATFLREKLASGPIDAAELAKAVSKAGVTRNALARARRSLAVVVSTPNGTGAPVWSLPQS